MSKTKNEPSSHTRSWRTIKQSGKNRAVTFQARKKRMQSLAVYVLYGTLAVTALFLAVTGVYIYKVKPELLYFGGPSSELKHVYFESDGVLTRAWLKGQMRLKANIGLMDIDIHALDAMLESEGQVKSAVVKRSFPDGLIIEVEEHSPVLRLKVAGKNGGSQALMVSSKGIVYKGNHYSDQTLEQLPWLAGLRLQKNKDGYLPIVEIPVVAELLELARTRIPQNYADWRIVNCDKFQGSSDNSWAVIKVKTRHTGELIFSSKGFEKQLIRLESILASMDIRDHGSIKRIDLSLDDHAAVKLSETDNRRGRR